MTDEVFKTVLAHLVAATSLLARAEDEGVKPSRAVASNAMFRQMMKDYDKAIMAGREAALNITSTEWLFCPECGCVETHYEEGRHKQCKECHQEWFSDIDYTEVLRSNIEHLRSLNKDAHAIIDRIWDIFGRPSYEELAGRTIYDMVQNVVDRERETADVNEKMINLVNSLRLEVNTLRVMNENRNEEIYRLRAGLEFYANPEIYKPHPHGPAFDRRDLSFHAKSVLETGK